MDMFANDSFVPTIVSIFKQKPNDGHLIFSFCIALPNVISVSKEMYQKNFFFFKFCKNGVRNIEN